MYENSKWCVVSDVEPAVLTVTGACAAASPAAPVLGENLQLWIQTYTGGNSPKSGSQVDRQPTTYGPSLEYGEVVYDEDEGVWTCELTVTGYTDDPELADYCYVNRMSGDYIVVGDAVKTVTLTYNQGTGKWVAPALPLTVTGGSTVKYGVAFLVTQDTGETLPDLPNTTNCKDFYVTVYGYEPQSDGTTVNKVLHSSTWGGYPSYVTVVFGVPQKGADGVWTCEATVDATARVEQQLEYFANSHYRLDKSEKTVKDVTLTYNEATGKWSAPSDGVTYGYPSSPQYKNGVAFELIKQYVITYEPGRDLSFGAPVGEAYEEDPTDAGDYIRLPDEVPFTTEKGYFAGWTQSLNGGTVFYTPGQSIPMFAADTTLKGSIAKYQTTATVYFIKSYTVDDGDTLTAAVSLDKCAATASAAASIQWGPGQLTLDAAGPDLVYTGSDVTYTLQGVGRSSDVSTVRFSFRISGSFDPDSVKLSALNGFVMASAQPEAGEDGVVYTVILTPGAAAALAEDKVTDLLQISLTAGSEAGQITVTPLSITYTPDTVGDDYVGLAGEALNTTVWVRYDINGDGKVTLSDVNMLKVYYQSAAGDDNWGQARVADLNDDGVVDVEDLTILMQYLLTI